MSSLPPLRALQVFEAVGHYGSISRAAQHLGISVGAVSQHMKLLEQALDASLTVKEGQRVRLSAIGERFHARCRTAFEELRSATAEVERAKTSLTLYVSSLPSILMKWLAPLMYDWGRSHRQIDIYLDSTLEDTSEAEGADFRVGYGHGGNLDNRAELFQDCVIPLCSPALLGEMTAVAKPEDLLDFPLISVISKPRFDSPPSWHEWFADCGCKLEHRVDIALTYSSTSAAIQAAIDGQGIMLAHYSMITPDLKAGRVVIPYQHALELPSPYFISWPHNALYKPQCQDFHRWVIARGRDQQRTTQDLLARNAVSRALAAE